MFGGARDEGTLDDTWSWDGKRWYRLSPADRPTSRMGARAAYDPRLRQVVMFGGTHVEATSECPDPLLQMRLHNTRPPGIKPDPCAAVFESAAQYQIRTDTWTWDGSNWRRQHPTHSPAQTARTGPVFDPTANAVVVFDFHPLGQTGTVWKWTGSDWEARSFPWVELGSNGAVARRPDAPGLIYQQLGVGPTCDTEASGYRVGDHGITFNCTKGTKGSSYTVTTWSWDGNRWTQLLPAHAPATWVPALATMTADRSVVLVEPSTEGTTWIWRDGDWHAIVQTVHPNSRIKSLAYDEKHRRVVVFGGVFDAFPRDYSSETWIWNGQEWAEPAK
jgi:hypothetical protein